MDSEIKAFYSHLNVLITGGTGLLGQLLVEKLLRVCPDIDGIYLILRGKRGKSAKERILQTYSDPMFDKLREVNSEFIKKIHIIEGDCSQLNLGLDELSRKVLSEKINIVFHCAASLNMESRLQDAVDVNVRGLRELLKMCHKMSNLKSVMFVSTAYSNCIHKTVEEKCYNAPMEPDTAIKIAQELEPKVLDNVTPMLIEGWPNTYCYSKAIAEEYINKNWGILPVGLFRPSVITPTHSEPVPGWTANFHGPVAILVAASLGIQRVAYGNDHSKLDVVPADLCTNALICTALETYKKFKTFQKEVPVYNYSAGNKRNISVKLIIQYASYFKYPLKDSMWQPFLVFTNCRVYYYILTILLHYIPGYLVDGFLFISGRKPRMIKAYEKISKVVNALNFFTQYEWNILNDNVLELWNTLNETDKKLFPFDMDVVNYENYWRNCTIGIKIYLMKESLDNVEYERQRFQRLVKLHNGLKMFLTVLGIAVFIKCLLILF